MKIVTGYQGAAHITSADAQGFNRGIVGADSYVFEVGNKLSTTLISANEVQIADGEGILQGVHFRIPTGEVESVAIENGTQSMKRSDLICARYTKDSNGIENVALVVIKGTEGSTASDPAYNQGNVADGDTPVDFPLYRVSLDGLTVSGVTALFSTASSLTGHDMVPYKGTVTNLNLATALGRYYAASSASNLPASKTACWILAFPFGYSNSQIVQMAFTSANAMYTRFCSNGTWTSWSAK